MPTPLETISTLDIRLRRAALALLWLLIATLALWLASVLRPVLTAVLDVLSPFIVAAILAYIFNPVVRHLQVRFRLRRMAGVLVAYAIILILALAFFAVLVPLLYVQTRNAAVSTVRSVPKMVERTQQWLKVRFDAEEVAQFRDVVERATGMHVPWPARQDSTSTSAIAVAVNDSETTSIPTPLIVPVTPVTTAQAGAAGNAVSAVSIHLADWMRTATRLVGMTLLATIGAIAFAAFVILITFYFLIDYGRVEHVVRVILPDRYEPRFFAVWHRIDSALGGFLRGQLTVAVIVAVLYSVALSVLGMMPYAILVGVLAGVGNLVPYLGPILGGVPTALWVLFGDRFDTGHEKLIGLLLIAGFTILVQTIDGFFFQPRIVGKSAAIHPLLVLLALLVGSQFGFGGLILAVPLAIIAKELFAEFIWRPLEARTVPTQEISQTPPGES